MMKKEIKVVFEDGTVMGVSYGTTVREILKNLNDDQIIALRVNGAAVAADEEIVEDSYINYIKVCDKLGQKIYRNGLKQVYINAVKQVFGEAAIVNIKHSLDKGLYTEITTRKRVDSNTVELIKKKMREICDRDLDFKRVNVSRDDAYDYVSKLGEYEKALNYLYMTRDSVTMYELDDDYNYFYYIMPASTKILKRFDLTYLGNNGIMLCYPINNIVPKYNPVPQVLDAFRGYEKKLSKMGVKYASELNKIIIDGNISDFIQTNEIIYDQNMRDIASMVASKNIKAVFISGPSSSGKTTTSKKLALFLKSMGYDSLVVSTDDYFKERVDSPKKEDGSYEFEVVDAIDIKLFNDHMKKLLNGEEVVMPTYNFITGEKEFKRKPITLQKHQILIVEGLHAINEKMNASIAKKDKLKLYISPFTPLALDRHNHIPTTDLRFLRRLVRDYRHRGYSAEATLTNWMGMRHSESVYVYPYQREADVIINTALSYEIGVLRTFAEPLLYSVSKESEFYEEAIRILKFMEGFLNIPSDFIPKTSVLREFIGDSYFE